MKYICSRRFNFSSIVLSPGDVVSVDKAGRMSLPSSVFETLCAQGALRSQDPSEIAKREASIAHIRALNELKEQHDIDVVRIQDEYRASLRTLIDKHQPGMNPGRDFQDEQNVLMAKAAADRRLVEEEYEKARKAQMCVNEH